MSDPRTYKVVQAGDNPDITGSGWLTLSEAREYAASEYARLNANAVAETRFEIVEHRAGYGWVVREEYVPGAIHQTPDWVLNLMEDSKA